MSWFEVGRPQGCAKRAMRLRLVGLPVGGTVYSNRSLFSALFISSSPEARLSWPMAKSVCLGLIKMPIRDSPMNVVTFCQAYVVFIVWRPAAVLIRHSLQFISHLVATASTRRKSCVRARKSPRRPWVKLESLQCSILSKKNL